MNPINVYYSCNLKLLSKQYCTIYNNKTDAQKTHLTDCLWEEERHKSLVNVY